MYLCVHGAGEWVQAGQKTNSFTTLKHDDAGNTAAVFTFVMVWVKRDGSQDGYYLVIIIIDTALMIWRAFSSRYDLINLLIAIVSLTSTLIDFHFEFIPIISTFNCQLKK